MHRLLKRQIKKFFGSIDKVPPELKDFIDDINEAYNESDSEKKLLERVQERNAFEINTFKQKEKELALLESKLKMLDSFSRFVPRQFLNFLGRESITDVALGDAVQKEMTILFCDIRDFTTLSEGMTVKDNFLFLNTYLKCMGPVIHAQGGFIDKFIGDAIMALFPDAPDQALRAAIDMRHELVRYNKTRAETDREAIDMGIGLNIGELMLGTVGSEERLSTTVIGDTVNLASRLDRLTRILNIPIVLADFVYRKLSQPEDFCLREIDSVQVKGKERPVVIYECFDCDPCHVVEKKKNTHSIFQMGLFQYKARNFKEARDLFKECLKLCAEDNISKIYVDYCEFLINNPPDSDWSGVRKL